MQDPAARLGFTDASRIISAMYAGGTGLDAVAAHHDDVSASLAADARTPPGCAYAAEYGDTGRSLIADLRADEAVARGRSAAACTQPDGTPHPDPFLAGRGWEVRGGLYQRTGNVAAERTADREAI